jgi:hypothetical protein
MNLNCNQHNKKISIDTTCYHNGNQCQCNKETRSQESANLLVFLAVKRANKFATRTTRLKRRPRPVIFDETQMTILLRFESQKKLTDYLDALDSLDCEDATEADSLIIK